MDAKVSEILGTLSYFRYNSHNLNLICESRPRGYSRYATSQAYSMGHLIYLECNYPKHYLQ